MSDHDAMLQTAIQAIERGETARARETLTRLLRIAPNNPEYWVWMSAATDSPKERRYCLQKALAANPDYEPARRGLILMGKMPSEQVTPVRTPEPYAWEARFKPATPAPNRGALPRSVVLAALAVFALMALSWGGWRVWQQVRPVHVPTPQLLVNITRTPTTVPTATPTPIDPLTLGHPTPLVLLLPATYTPTPLAVGTPHLAEAYRLGMRAMHEQRWEDALRYFQQTIQAEKSKPPDMYFYIGEVYRHMGRWNEAVAAYRQALQAQSDFAPAEVGLAQTLLAMGNHQQEAFKLLQDAVRHDPSYGEGHVALARYNLDHHNADEALAELQQAEQSLPDSALVPLYRAEAYLQLDDPQAAYEQAKLANQRDITLLPAYKLLGEASLALGKLDDATRYFRTYLTYTSDDPEAYHLLAETYLQLKNLDGALAAAKKAAETSPYDADVLRLLAQVYLARGEADQAVEPLETAVRIYPKDFSLRMALTEALLAADHPGDAFKQLREAEPLLDDKEQWYTFYYWRAKVLTALDVLDAAIEDWQRVLDAPEGLVPDKWRTEAKQNLQALLPTATPTATATPTPSPEPTP